MGYPITPPSSVGLSALLGEGSEGPLLRAEPVSADGAPTSTLRYTRPVQFGVGVVLCRQRRNDVCRRSAVSTSCHMSCVSVTCCREKYICVREKYICVREKYICVREKYICCRDVRVCW